MRRLIVVVAVMTALSLAGCGLFPSESQKPQMPKVEQGTMPQFPEKPPEKKQQEPQTQEQKTPTSNTRNTKPQLPIVEQGTMPHFPEK